MPETLARPTSPHLQRDGLEIRAVELRAITEDGKRQFSGVAVPWNDPTLIRGWFQDFTEEVERGAVQDSDDAKVFWRHSEPIGRLVSAEDTDRGWEITGELSATPRGDEAYTLLRDGVIDRMSIGFEPVEHREVKPAKGSTDPVKIIRTKIRVREVSLVPFPAYDGATVDAVRHATREDHPMPTATAPATAADVAEVREHAEELDRRFQTIVQRLEDLAAPDENAAPPITFRSAGELVKELVAGNERAVAEFTAWKTYLTENRDWNPAGQTTADHINLNAWVGDLTRIVGEGPGIRNWFAKGTLPAEGNNIEFGRLAANTLQVQEQTAEGQTLAFGEISTETDTAPVRTYGGYTRLSRQAIERSSVNVVQHNLTGLSLAAAARLNAAFRTFYATTAAAQVTAGNDVAFRATVDTIAEITADDWIDAVVDAAVKFEALALPMEALIVDVALFKHLSKLKVNGDLVMNVFGSGVNRVGEMNLPGLTGELANVTVLPNLLQTTPAPAAEGWTGATFANRRAIRSYESALSSLTDEDITVLSRDYSVYQYAAVADEIPAALVPVTFGAAA